MPFDLSKYLVLGISSRALFDLEKENKIFEESGLEKYTEYQIKHENDILEPGTGFSLIKAILDLNKRIPNHRQTEVIIMSRNNCETSLRIQNSINHYGLDITRSCFTSGRPVSDYLDAYKVHLFLSANDQDVKDALKAGVAAAKIYDYHPTDFEPLNQIRIAFDGDAVLFSNESELIYQNKGMAEFFKHEEKNARIPLKDGPFAVFLRALSYVQKRFKAADSPIRTALITARNSPATERVVRTLRDEWKIRIDEAHFLGGASKDGVLKVFKPQIFFDDQNVHCESASKVVPTAQVLTESRKLLLVKKTSQKKKSIKRNKNLNLSLDFKTKVPDVKFTDRKRRISIKK